MISLEQVRALEERVERAVAYIASLRAEGAELGRRLIEAQSFIDDAANELAEAEEKAAAAEQRAVAVESQREAEVSAWTTRIREVEARLTDMAERVAAAETRAAEMSARAEEYRRDQAKIEEGIVHALEKLDSFEDLVLAQPGAAVAAEKNDALPEESPEKPAIASPAQAPEAETVDEVGISVKSERASEPAPNELDIF